jgi:hypothetical protein
MRFARAVFLIAGLWGLIVLTPLYFTFDLVGRSYPPAITHPDFYYGFVSVAWVWQIAFLLIAANPAPLHGAGDSRKAHLRNDDGESLRKR